MAGMFTSLVFMLADDDVEPWTLPAVDHVTRDGCYLGAFGLLDMSTLETADLSPLTCSELLLTEHSFRL